MSIIYELSSGFWTGVSRDVSDRDPRPLGWIETDTLPPAYNEGEGALWTTTGWVVAALSAPPTLPLPEQRAARLADLADYRWQRETAGILWTRPEGQGVIWIATDRESQGKLLAERTAAISRLRGPEDVWKCGDPATGQPQWLVLLDAEIIAIADAARAYVAACFRREGEIAAIIAASDEPGEVDVTVGWPVAAG